MKIKHLFTLLLTLILVISVSGTIAHATHHRSPDGEEVSEMMERAELALGVQIALHEYRTELDADGNDELAIVGGYVDEDQTMVIQVNDLASRDYFDRRLNEDGHTSYRFEFVDYVFSKEYLEDALIRLMDSDPDIKRGSVNVQEQRLEIEMTQATYGELPTSFVLDEGVTVYVSEYREAQYDHEGPGIYEYLRQARLKIFKQEVRQARGVNAGTTECAGQKTKLVFNIFGHPIPMNR